MNNNSILLIDPNFEPAESKNLSLLVKIGSDTFSYAITNTSEKTLLAVYDEQECEDGYDKLQERLKTDAYLKLPYKEVSIAAHTQNIIFVPQELFNQNDTVLYTKFFTETDVENVYIQPSLQQSVQTIFALPPTAEKIIGEHWPNSTKLQHNAGLIELAAQVETASVIIDFSVSSFQIIYINRNKLTFSQSYQFDNLDELTYYIILIINELNINTKQTKLKLCGIIHEDDEKWNLLAQYFEKINLWVATPSLNTDILDDMPAHYYTSLLALQQCV